MAQFKLSLGDRVAIINTTQTGQVIARSDYLDGTPNCYLVRGLDAHGNLVERWFSETVLAYQE